MRKLALTLIVLLAACAPPRPSSGVVVERVYTPSVSGSGWATGSCTGTGSDGSIVSGTCSGSVWYTEGEKWHLIVRASDGQVWAEPVTPEVWAKYDKGDTATFERDT